MSIIPVNYSVKNATFEYKNLIPSELRNILWDEETWTQFTTYKWWHTARLKGTKFSLANRTSHVAVTVRNRTTTTSLYDRKITSPVQNRKETVNLFACYHTMNICLHKWQSTCACLLDMMDCRPLPGLAQLNTREICNQVTPSCFRDEIVQLWRELYTSLWVWGAAIPRTKSHNGMRKPVQRCLGVLSKSGRAVGKATSPWAYWCGQRFSVRGQVWCSWCSWDDPLWEALRPGHRSPESETLLRSPGSLPQKRRFLVPFN